MALQTRAPAVIGFVDDLQGYIVLGPAFFPEVAGGVIFVRLRDPQLDNLRQQTAGIEGAISQPLADGLVFQTADNPVRGIIEIGECGGAFGVA